MKALIYKEMRLSMHPICYIFIILFPLMILIPSYPLGIGFIYVLTCYPILFLGANKGQQSNDLLYSTLLPVRKKDIVMARIITVILMQVAFMLIMSALYPLARFINELIITRHRVEKQFGSVRDQKRAGAASASFAEDGNAGVFCEAGKQIAAGV